MTFEAKLAFIAFFLLCWCVIGLIPWAIVAVWARGRGALLALPLALTGACAAGVLVPLLGQRDGGGYALSLGAAVIGSALACAGGIFLYRKLASIRPVPAKPVAPHPIGAPRPTETHSSAKQADH